MLIIPELETVVILVPRTGSRSLKNAVLHRYPQSFLLYRHMEADGVPMGYNRWRRVGVVRDPVDRLWSLYKSLQTFGDTWEKVENKNYVTKMRESVEVPFEQWLLTNELVFTSPYDSEGGGRFFPAYAVAHSIPENRKSQFIYLRPDLGTEIIPYSQSPLLHRQLGIEDIILRQNATEKTRRPALSLKAKVYVKQWFAWDMKAIYHIA